MDAYKSGTLHPKDCRCNDPDRQEVNHAVVIVGYGKSERKDCENFWKIRNSWGSDWGEDGFFNLCADKYEDN